MKNLGLLFVMVISLIFTVSCVSKEVPVTETYYENDNKTEYKTEVYTDTEDVHVDTYEGQTYPTLVITWQAGLYFVKGESSAGTTYYGYEIDTSEHARNKVIITLSQMAEGYIIVLDLTGLGQISNMPETISAWRERDPQTGDLWLNPAEETWLDKFEAITTNPARVLFSQPMNADTKSEISFDATGIQTFAILANTWNARAITNVKLLWSDNITEKRTITKERQVPYEVPVQVEKQRTVTKTEKVPFWEVLNTKQPAETEPSSPSTTEIKPVVEETSSNTTAPAASPVTIDDDFSNPNSGWGTSSDGSGEFAYEGAEYSIFIGGPHNRFGYHLNSVIGTQEDFTVAVDARTLNAGTDAAGIVFRDQREQDKDSFYVFWVNSGSQTYAIQKYIRGVWATDIKEFTTSNYINRGAYNTNRLKVICKGSQIEVYVNDYKLTTVTDTSLTSGFIGLAAETFSSSNAWYHFDNFKLYTSD